ncbi:hypothetical protein [Micromonospora sp. NPDC048063]|uniref:hypothetical protein n=1 Tax=Micromonospora sp. NPDC048063 TaxID=3364256 RepID=UPI003712D8AC
MENEDDIKAHADELIGELSQSREGRDKQYRRARNIALGMAQPNRPHHEAHTFAETPLLREIDRRWNEDLRDGE